MIQTPRARRRPGRLPAAVLAAAVSTALMTGCTGGDEAASPSPATSAASDDGDEAASPSPSSSAASDTPDPTAPASSAPESASPAADDSSEEPAAMDRTRLVAALRVAFDQQDSTATHAGILDADTLGGEFEVPVTISLEPGQHDVTLLCSGQGAVMMYSEPWEQEFFYNPEPAEQAAGPEFPGSGTVATASFAALGEEGVPAEIDSCGDGIARATHRVTVERGDDTTLWFSSLDDGEVTVAYTVQPVDGPANAEAVTATATQLREVRAALAPWPATGQAHRAVVSLAPPQEGKDHRMVVLEAPAYSERMSVTVHCMGEAWMDIARQESSGDLDTVEPLGARECYPDRVRSRPHELISHAEVGMAVYLVGPATGEEPLAVSYAVDGPVQ